MTNPINPQALLTRFATAAEKLRGTGACPMLESIADAIGGA